VSAADAMRVQQARAALKSFPADAVMIGHALEDAGRYRRDRAEAWCADCLAHPAGACDDHVDQLDQADAYAELGRQLQEAGR
jgi:hypothetical protein